jgi:Pyridoxamine 5'-phosphate oxidase
MTYFTHQLDFIARFPDAAMISSRRDGSPHAARVELGVVDGRIRTTGAPSLVRTNHIRRDPRCTLFVFGPSPLWLGIDATACILDGPDAVERCIDFLRSRHGQPGHDGVIAHDDQLGTDRHYELDEYREYAKTRGLFVFDFEIRRAYGNYDLSRF